MPECNPGNEPARQGRFGLTYFPSVMRKPVSKFVWIVFTVLISPPRIVGWLLIASDRNEEALHQYLHRRSM